jgi:hypothetical protein
LFVNNSHGLKIKVKNPHLFLVGLVVDHDPGEEFGQDDCPHLLSLLGLHDLAVRVGPQVHCQLDTFGNLKL